MNKNDFLALLDNKPQSLSLEGIGQVNLKKLTVTEQSKIAKTSENDNVQATLQLIAYSLVDDEGVRLFSDKEIDKLGQMSLEQMTTLTTAINELNGFNKSLDDVKKNS